MRGCSSTPSCIPTCCCSWLFARLIVYGWNRWLQHLGDDGRVRVAPLPRRQAVDAPRCSARSARWRWAAVMHRYTDAALPWLDAALTAFSLVAQWWQARRHAAAWWLWIVVDVIYVGEYVYKYLLITVVLYAGFVVLAVIGPAKSVAEGRVGDSADRPA